MTENRYELNKNLAQMLKGGVIMDVQILNKQELQRQQVQQRLWPWSGFQRIFVQLVVSLV